MNLEEASNILRRLLNERRAIEYLEEIISTADAQEKLISERQRTIDLLKKSIADLVSREKAAKEATAQAEAEKIRCEEEFSDAIASARAEFDSAKTAFRDELDNYKQALQKDREKALESHNEFMAHLDAEKAAAQQQLDGIKSELEAVRRKMSGLLSNG